MSRGVKKVFFINKAVRLFTAGLISALKRWPREQTYEVSCTLSFVSDFFIFTYLADDQLFLPVSAVKEKVLMKKPRRIKRERGV